MHDHIEIELEIQRVPCVSVVLGVPGQVPAYTGPYTVTPAVVEQMLETTDKRMTDDVTIHAIPFFEVSNPQGGNTIYIGSEV